MAHDEHGNPWKRGFWGVFLMAVGGVFLLEQLGYVEAPSLWKLWPTVLLIVAVSCLLEGKPGNAAMMSLMGLAFFAAEFGWWGLTWATFWPLLIVAVGVGILIGAICREGERCCREESHE